MSQSESQSDTRRADFVMCARASSSCRLVGRTTHRIGRARTLGAHSAQGAQLGSAAASDAGGLLTLARLHACTHKRTHTIRLVSTQTTRATIVFANTHTHAHTNRVQPSEKTTHAQLRQMAES